MPACARACAWWRCQQTGSDVRAVRVVMSSSRAEKKKGCEAYSHTFVERDWAGHERDTKDVFGVQSAPAVCTTSEDHRTRAMNRRTSLVVHVVDAAAVDLPRGQQPRAGPRDACGWRKQWRAR